MKLIARRKACAACTLIELLVVIAIIAILAAMLLPVLTMGGGANAFATWDAWMKTGARRMGLYLYHDDQSFFIMPKVDIHQSARRIHYAVASGMARHFYQEMYPFWPLDGD